MLAHSCWSASSASTPLGGPACARQSEPPASHGSEHRGAEQSGVPRRSRIGSYGTTYYGGAYAPGCIFSIRITRGGHVTEELLHSFSGPDGDYPIAGLIDVKGVLYGTTVSGGEGPNGRGTVFSITTSGTENLLHTFAGGPYDGSDPYGNVTYNNGTFYGTTYTGGAYRGFRRLGGGTVFSVTASGTEKVLHSFGKVMNNGASPMAGVIYVRGTLYGTTQEGGHRGCGGSTRDCGTVFALTP